MMIVIVSVCAGCVKEREKRSELDRRRECSVTWKDKMMIVVTMNNTTIDLENTNISAGCHLEMIIFF